VAYRFQRGEPVPQAIRRVASEQLEGAIDSLRSRGKRDEAIHDARKRVKKVRAVLRLVRGESAAFYSQENTRLRDAGRGLSEFRDAAVVIETFDHLIGEQRAELGERDLHTIRRGLLLGKSRGERRAGMKAAIQSVSAVLDSAARDVPKWPLTGDGFASIAPGLGRTFRRGRNTMDAAHKYPRPESFHEWRKRVKDLWYHTRLLVDLWPDVLDAYEKCLKQLEDWLGAGHNLEILRAKITADPQFYGPPDDIETLLRLIGKSEKDLRKNALDLGARIYAESPRDFVQRLEHLWAAW
jgi:CHAD domain-containing protein